MHLLNMFYKVLTVSDQLVETAFENNKTAVVLL